MTIEERIQAAGGGWAGAYLELTKPGITGFVALTAVASYLVAALPDIVYFDLFHLVLGTSLSTAGSGRIPEAHARFFGWVLLLAGVGHIWFWLGWLPALVTAVAALLYDAVYTPLKLRSPLATPVGAVPGALPVLIGWTAHTGNLDARGVTLFGILFLWQLSHVLALGWNLRADYERAGFQLIPPGSAGLVAGLMVGYAALLALVSTLPTVLGMAGNAYLGAAILLGAGMIAVSVAFLRNPTRQNCNRVFVGSLLYHPLLLGTMVAGAF